MSEGIPCCRCQRPRGDGSYYRSPQAQVCEPCRERDAPPPRPCRTCNAVKPVTAFRSIYAHQCEACRHPPCVVCGGATAWEGGRRARRTCSQACLDELRIQRAREVGRRLAARAKRRKRHRCPACAEAKPRTPEHWYVSKRDADGRVAGLDSICKPCKRAIQRDAYRTNEGRRRAAQERAAARHREERRLIASDPAYAAEHRRRYREYQRQYKERVRGRRGRAERPTVRERNPRLPALPLVLTIEQIAAGQETSLKTVCAELEISDRVLREWRGGGRPSVQLATADRVLVAAGLNWHDVWEPEEFPEVAAMLSA